MRICDRPHPRGSFFVFHVEGFDPEPLTSSLQPLTINQEPNTSNQQPTFPYSKPKRGKRITDSKITRKTGLPAFHSGGKVAFQANGRPTPGGRLVPLPGSTPLLNVGHEYQGCQNANPIEVWIAVRHSCDATSDNG